MKIIEILLNICILQFSQRETKCYEIEINSTLKVTQKRETRGKNDTKFRQDAKEDNRNYR